MVEVTECGFGVTVESDSSLAVVKKDGKLLAKFKGETAWMDAERFASDLTWEEDRKTK
jgi:hypothetical protein